MATFTKYQTFIQHLCDKKFDLYGTTDQLKAVIHTDSPTVGTDDDVGDLSQINNANGYTTNGADIQNDMAAHSSGTVTLTAVDVTWTASGGNLGSSTTGRYVSIHDEDSTTDLLMCSFDYGSTFTVASGETFTLDFGASLATFA